MSKKENQEPVKLEEKKWWKKPLIWIPSLIVILTCLTLLIELPQKIYNAYNFICSNDLETTPIRGKVTNQLGSPVEGAIVKLDVLPFDSTTTTSDGGFYFAEVSGKAGERVRLYVFAKGYKPHNEYVTLPGPIKIVLNE